MWMRRASNVTKPPPGARVDTTHPLGRFCQAALLFTDGQGTAKNVGPLGVSTYLETPVVQYYQTQALRTPMLFGSTIPVMTYNAFGPALFFGGDFSGMDIGLNPLYETYDLDYPEYAVGASVTRGQTICVVRRKVDTTLRPSSLFGVEDVTYPNSLMCCGTHCPFSDGNVYWDYGFNSGSNRLVVSGLTFTTQVERYIFTAGPRGSNVWQNGIKVGSQTTPLVRVVPARDAEYSGWTLNGGNRRHVNGSGDVQEINFIMYLATQWTDDLCRWWFAEPFAAFYSAFMARNYYFMGAAPVAGPDQLVIAPQAPMPRGPQRPVAY